MGQRHFVSDEAYRKWLAYIHMHGQAEATPGNQDIFIGGHHHKVKHRI